MAIYDRAVKAVPKAQRLALYELYISRASESYGIGKVCMWLAFGLVDSSPHLQLCLSMQRPARAEES
jgi:hypothetical protein